MTELTHPTFEDIRAAAERLDGIAVRTPLLYSAPLSALFAAQVYIKPENLQRVGAFKFRGAYNRLCQLSAAEKARGVVAFSSGNHAQGVAAAAQMLGIAATIVMPRGAPAIKRANTLSYGAAVIDYDPETESREEVAGDIAAREGAILVPSFEDFDIICGQGTVGLEIMEQAREQNVAFDEFYCPVGGGGLISGCATAIRALSPATKICGVEPEDFDDVRRSLIAGERRRNARNSGSVCDALLTTTPGPLTFALMQKNLDAVLTVSDEEALRAVKAAWEALKLVIEPGGAVALAALLSGKVDVTGKTVCLLLSGGNVDAATYIRALQQD